MKSRVSLLVMMAALLVIFSAAAIAENLLTDGGLETNAQWSDSPWVRGFTGTGAYVWPARIKVAALDLLTPTDGIDGWSYNIMVKHKVGNTTTPIVVDVTLGAPYYVPVTIREYQASIWVRMKNFRGAVPCGGSYGSWGCDTLQNFILRVVFYNSAKVQIGFVDAAPVTTTFYPGWTEVSMIFTPPAGTAYCSPLYKANIIDRVWNLESTSTPPSNTSENNFPLDNQVDIDKAYLGPYPITPDINLTIGDCNALPDGAVVKLQDKVLTATVTDNTPLAPVLYAWIEERDRSAGIKVVMPSISPGPAPALNIGQSVRVYGTMASENSTRVIKAAYCAPALYDALTDLPLKPLAMTGNTLAGGPRPRNMLTNPGFENTTNGWTMSNNSGYTSGMFWLSWTLGTPPYYWTDGYTPFLYMVIAKHTYVGVPLDSTTPVVGTMEQNVVGPSPGTYEASVWYRTRGTGTKWDGPGGQDQYAQMKVQKWADAACTIPIGSPIESAKIETKVTTWTKLSMPVVLDSSVAAVTFSLVASNVDQFGASEVDWDDPLLGNVVAGGGTYVRGLKVKVWGKVVGPPYVSLGAPDYDTMYITDGSGQLTFVKSDPNLPTLAGYAGGEYVAVTGIAGMGIDGIPFVKMGIDDWVIPQGP